MTKPRFLAARTTNRWTGATGSDFRIKRDPAKLLRSAVARSTQPLGGNVTLMNQLIFTVLAIACLSSVIIGQVRWNRSKAIQNLSSCGTPKTGCDETSAAYLVGLYDRGDHGLLKLLVHAGSFSDGALSEVLADFYGDMLWKRPHSFLEALSSERPKDQQTDCMLASVIEGKQLRDVRRSLRKFSSNKYGRLSKVARKCFLEINRAKASNGR